MFASDLADFLESNGIGTVGSDIVVGRMPQSPVNAIMLLRGASTQQDAYLDLRNEVVDIYVRNKSAQLAFDKAFSIYRLLQFRSNVTIGGYYVYNTQVSSIDDFDFTPEDAKLYRLTATVIYRDINNVIS
jgi:hypothetical protein